MKLQFITGVLILLLATCSAQPAVTNSGIEGQVFIGALCPVLQQGQTCPAQPYQATLTVNNSNGREVAKVQTDVEGHFKLALEPGAYILHPESSNVLPFATEQIFSVTAGKFTAVTVTYDSGIR